MKYRHAIYLFLWFLLVPGLVYFLEWRDVSPAYVIVAQFSAWCGLSLVFILQDGKWWYRVLKFLCMTAGASMAGFWRELV